MLMQILKTWMSYINQYKQDKNINAIQDLIIQITTRKLFILKLKILYR